MSNKTATANSNDLVKLYQVIDEDGVITTKYKYLTGSPKNYRFDGRTGDFNLDGKMPLGKKLTIQPISFRFMEDSLFARKSDSTGETKRELWCEVYFIDEKKSVSYIMFNNSSARALQRIIETLYYEDLQLNELVLTITSEKKENAKGKYFVATFDYVPATLESISEYKQLCTDLPIYSKDTIQESADNILFFGLYPSHLLQSSPIQPLIEA